MTITDMVNATLGQTARSEYQRGAVVDNIAGVYLLYQKEKLLYVGQTYNLNQRLIQHQEKPFTHAIVYHINELVSRLRVEGILILWLLPELNRGMNLGLCQGKVWEVKWRRSGSGPVKRKRTSPSGAKRSRPQ
jgi:hypothetical protein